jgi:TolB-like protein
VQEIKRLIREVHRRSLWQIISIYGAVSWISLQVVQTIVESANLPSWLPALALVLLLIGLPIVVATGFVQEGAPRLGGNGDGSSAEEDPIAGQPEVRSGADDVSASQPSTARSLFTWKNAIMGGVGAFALWGVVATFLISTGRPLGPSPLNASERPSVAVLPLEALSVNGGDDDAFARGIHDEIITRLSKIGAIRVTSRTSVMEYAGQTGSMREIADDLGVDMLVEGSIQRTADQIALNIQLIDGETDEHLWAESYNRAYTLENVFELQRELAERIALELEASVSPEEAAEIGKAPTSNTDAYATFLQANDFYYSGPRTDDFAVAIQLYERATEQDPSFALAHARLAFAIGQRWQVGGEEAQTEEMERRARAAASTALELDPALPEAHLAQGQLHYALDADWGRALSSLNRASDTGLKGDYYHLLGAAQRRLGDFDGSIATWEEMVRVDPRSAHYKEDLGTAFQNAGRMEEAERYLRESIATAPDESGPYDFLLGVLIAREGSTESAWVLLGEARTATGEDWEDWGATLHWFDRDVEAALESADGEGWRASMMATVGRMEEARVLAEGPHRGWLEASEAGPRNGYFQLWGAELAVALGNADDARTRAEEALRQMPVSRDAIIGPDVLYTASVVFAQIGDSDRALEILEELVSVPSEYTGAYIALDPGFDPLRGEGRFEAIIGR